jgi:hypothetical protein
MTAILAGPPPQAPKRDSIGIVEWELWHSFACQADFDCGSDWSLVDSSLVSLALGIWAV